MLCLLVLPQVLVPEEIIGQFEKEPYLDFGKHAIINCPAAACKYPWPDDSHRQNMGPVRKYGDWVTHFIAKSLVYYEGVGPLEVPRDAIKEICGQVDTLLQESDAKMNNEKLDKVVSSIYQIVVRKVLKVTHEDLKKLGILDNLTRKNLEFFGGRTDSRLNDGKAWELTGYAMRLLDRLVEGVPSAIKTRKFNDAKLQVIDDMALYLDGSLSYHNPVGIDSNEQIASESVLADVVLHTRKMLADLGLQTITALGSHPALVINPTSNHRK